MKKILILMLIIFTFSVLATGKSLMITVHGNYFVAADDDFAQEYGGKKYFPEGKIALKLSGNFYLWGSYGFFSTGNTWDKWSHKNIENADIAASDTVDKTIISGGLGYYMGYIERNELAIKIEIGACKIANDRETADTGINSGSVISHEENTVSGFGARGNFGVTYGIFNNIFAEISFGYLLALDKVDDQTIRLGGFRASLGLGLRF
ncbi:MAG: hypothetical protein KAW12_23825 [Candidatus Aminicenantes bacterium]|nr:hypothetical protein [Candidatus Aminicenantes bacterium]